MEFATVDTKVGSFAFVARDTHLVATYLPDKKDRVKKRVRSEWPDANENPSLMPAFRKRVSDYFSGQQTSFDERLDLSDVPPFRRRVLEQCQRIPYGKTASYRDLARAVGNANAARAVGTAMAHNPLPLVVPCHRVLRSDGSIGGFSSPSGVAEKKRMLRLEGCDAL